VRKINHREWLRRSVVWLPVLAAILVTCCPGSTQAASDGFNIQVSPSPLVVQLTPGHAQTASVTVRNLSNHSETLLPRLNGFTLDPKNEKIDLTPSVPLGLGEWVSFKQSSLTIAPGGSQLLDVVFNTPDNVGFSYSLAITLTPADKLTANSGANYEASVAIFNLININRPDAKRELSIESFTADKSRYEYLPANFNLVVKNRGNVIDQPAGTIFIQREFGDNEPIASIPLNAANRYILPDTSRTLSSEWADGFPRYVTDGASKPKLEREWRNVGKLRIGKYTAKAVLTYNDGTRDIPLIASTTFWVLPWKLLGVSFVIGLLILTGLIAWVRLVLKGTKKVRTYAKRR
jgi:hypothetical protein